MTISELKTAAAPFALVAIKAGAEPRQAITAAVEHIWETQVPIERRQEITWTGGDVIPTPQRAAMEMAEAYEYAGARKGGSHPANLLNLASTHSLAQLRAMFETRVTQQREET